MHIFAPRRRSSVRPDPPTARLTTISTTSPSRADGMVVMGMLGDFGVGHPGAVEEVDVGRPRLECGHGDTRILGFAAQRPRERQDERLGRAAHCFEWRGRRAGDGSREEHLAAALRHPVADDVLGQTHRGNHVQVDQIEFLVQVGLRGETPLTPTPALSAIAATDRLAELMTL